MQTYYYGRCAVRQWTIHHVGMSRDPADIGGTPINITGVIVEDILESCCRINQISRGGMENSFRFSGRTAIYKKNTNIRFVVEETKRTMCVLPQNYPSTNCIFYLSFYSIVVCLSIRLPYSANSLYIGNYRASCKG